MALAIEMKRQKDEKNFQKKKKKKKKKKEKKDGKFLSRFLLHVCVDELY